MFARVSIYIYMYYMYTTLDKIHQMNEDWCHTLDSQLFDSRQIATGETHTKHMAFLGRKNMQLSCFYMFHIRLGREREICNLHVFVWHVFFG